MRLKIYVLILGMAILGGSIAWMVYSRSCERKGAQLRAQVERIRNDARHQLTVGTKKEDALRSYSEHGMHALIQDSAAYGGIQTSGCTTIGCGFGTMPSYISVRVDLDDTGAVKSDPVVTGMYTDCL